MRCRGGAGQGRRRWPCPERSPGPKRPGPRLSIVAQRIAQRIGRWFLGDPVADPRFSRDQFARLARSGRPRRACGAAAHVHVQVVGLGGVGAAPHGAQQPALGQEPARRPIITLSSSYSRGVRSMSVTGDRDDTTRDIHDDRARGEGPTVGSAAGPPARRRSAPTRARSSSQAERLGHVVVGARPRGRRPCRAPSLRADRIGSAWWRRVGRVERRPRRPGRAGRGRAGSTSGRSASQSAQAVLAPSRRSSRDNRGPSGCGRRPSLVAASSSTRSRRGDRS